jgi:hypothetical protein
MLHFRAGFIWGASGCLVGCWNAHTQQGVLGEGVGCRINDFLTSFVKNDELIDV